jgi:hypothetical protein
MHMREIDCRKQVAELLWEVGQNYEGASTDPLKPLRFDAIIGWKD